MPLWWYCLSESISLALHTVHNTHLLVQVSSGCQFLKSEGKERKQQNFTVKTQPRGLLLYLGVNLNSIFLFDSFPLGYGPSSIHYHCPWTRNSKWLPVYPLNPDQEVRISYAFLLFAPFPKFTFALKNDRGIFQYPMIMSWRWSVVHVQGNTPLRFKGWLQITGTTTHSTWNGVGNKTTCTNIEFHLWGHWYCPLKAYCSVLLRKLYLHYCPDHHSLCWTAPAEQLPIRSKS